MSRRAKARRPAPSTRCRKPGSKQPPTSYPAELLRAIGRFLPKTGLRLLPNHAYERWTPRLLVMGILLLVFSGAQTLKDRFADARQSLVKMYPGRRRPGGSYQGFINALAACSERLLEGVCRALREVVQEVAAEHWTVRGWALFGSDGSKYELPMTEDNEHVHGCASKKNSVPQLYVTMLFHVGSGLPWAFVRGPACSSEREQLRQMLDLLPAGAMLTADAGCTGYDLLQQIMAGGRSLVIRVGANVTLLHELGYVRERGQTVYLWPHDKQGVDRKGRRPKDLSRVCPPLVLRLITLVDGRNRKMNLLTNVLEEERLSDADAVEIYRRRWGVELIWRSIKQTLSRRKMLSDSARNAEVEMDWAIVGFWLLGLMSVQEILQAGHVPVEWSVAQSLRIVRRTMAGQRCRGPNLFGQLARAIKDRYVRTRPKRARHYARKKTQRPPGAALARNATAAEIELAQRLREAHAPECIAA